MWNVDGWKYIMEEEYNEPPSYWHWYKNLHDNNGNGIFEPDYDGVQINTNFDYSWEQGSSDPSSNGYRGPFPFSEKESQVKRDYAQRQKPVLSINNHSFGEVVAWISTLNGEPDPDSVLNRSIADSVAQRIPFWDIFHPGPFSRHILLFCPDRKGEYKGQNNQNTILICSCCPIAETVMISITPSAPPGIVRLISALAVRSYSFELEYPSVPTTEMVTLVPAGSGQRTSAYAV